VVDGAISMHISAEKENTEKEHRLVGKPGNECMEYEVCWVKDKTNIS